MARLAQHHRRQGSDTAVPSTSDQGADQSPKPLIIGPEEDYDPGYFNNEVTVSWFSPFVTVTPAAVDWKQLELPRP